MKLISFHKIVSAVAMTTTTTTTTVQTLKSKLIGISPPYKAVRSGEYYVLDTTIRIRHVFWRSCDKTLPDSTEVLDYFVSTLTARCSERKENAHVYNITNLSKRMCTRMLFLSELIRFVSNFDYNILFFISLENKLLIYIYIYKQIIRPAMTHPTMLNHIEYQSFFSIFSVYLIQLG